MMSPGLRYVSSCFVADGDEAENSDGYVSRLPTYLYVISPREGQTQPLRSIGLKPSIQSFARAASHAPQGTAKRSAMKRSTGLISNAILVGGVRDLSALSWRS